MQQILNLFGWSKKWGSLWAPSSPFLILPSLLASVAFLKPPCQAGRWPEILWCHSPHWCQMPSLGLAGWKNDQLGFYSSGSMLQAVGSSLPAFSFLLLIPKSEAHTQLVGSSAFKVWYSPSEKLLICLLLQTWRQWQIILKQVLLLVNLRAGSLQMCRLLEENLYETIPRTRLCSNKRPWMPHAIVTCKRIVTSLEKGTYKHGSKKLLVHIHFIFFVLPYLFPSAPGSHSVWSKPQYFPELFCVVLTADVRETVNSCFEAFKSWALIPSNWKWFLFMLLIGDSLTSWILFSLDYSFFMVFL